MNISVDEKIYLLGFIDEMNQPFDGKKWSCFIMALREARKLCGRDIFTGENKNNTLISLNEDAILGNDSPICLVSYLLVLDLIGEVFKTRSFSTKKTNNIYKALKQFSDLQDTEIDVLIALRNSLAHNFSLINIPRYERDYPTQRHKFILNNIDDDFLIKFPQDPWDGDYSKKDDKYYTEISTANLIEKIEEVIKCLRTKIESNAVELALREGLAELKGKFLII